MIPYGRQIIDGEDISAVVNVLQSDYLTQGPEVPRFESAIAQYCHANYGIAFNSATSGLHAACLALGVGPGDVVWTSPITFVASANCARYCGASIDFVDINPITYNISVERLVAKLEDAKLKKCLPKVIIPVHFSGLPADMRAIHELSKIYKFSIIEDAAHAIGASYLDDKVGSCRYSDITVFSFHPVKIITTAEGGMALTNSQDLADKLRMICSHGITRDETLFLNKNQGSWYYEQQSLGFNYRMTELQAALGGSQLKKLDLWVSKRHFIADIYDKKLSNLPLILPKRNNNSRSSLHLYVVQVDDTKTALTRRNVFDQLRSMGIGVNVHYIPVHMQPDYSRFNFSVGDFSESELYYSRAISLPMFAGLSTEDQTVVIDSLNKIFS
ncbi:UDP-4-amino-4,6-dideoxy-N-acetyl-beta-L-altrosamine transaminase [Polynucleobacter paneuropaeus]|jgi:UDP-4-amino-4,6-dideoxy-N-acetyl-beta-L-altrosamine transaminase|nr:UDP-4-amino-4,6-dideoxy-N-acetyl-beta-L-altrosamine transaminase [Polynucleobacter paneuropaeus]